MNFRRSLKTKILILSLVFVTFVFYIKFISNNTDGIENGVELEGNLLKNVDNQFHGSVDQYKQYIDIDIGKQIPGLGDNGEAAALSNAVSKEIGERQFKKIALNEELSEHISYNRTLQDARNPLCRTEHFNLNELPTTSVVIIFYNVNMKCTHN